MLSRENRLISGKDFDLAYKNGQFFSAGTISLRVVKNKLTTARIGLSVGLKFSPKAVRRNKVKRWLREIAKKHIQEIKAGFDIVIMLKKEKTPLTYQTLEHNFKEALYRGNLIIKQLK